jgi:hypothetical protein
LVDLFFGGGDPFEGLSAYVIEAEGDWVVMFMLEVAEMTRRSDLGAHDNDYNILI